MPWCDPQACPLSGGTVGQTCNFPTCLTADLHRRDFKTISKHMGYSRTPGACKSYFSKNRHRLGLDSVLAEHQRGKDEMDEGELEADPKVLQLFKDF